MNKTKIYYFAPNGIFCYPKKYHTQYMIENNIKEMSVFRARVSRGIKIMYCLEFSEFGETKDCCGLDNCPKYTPRNKKSGICTHYGYCYEPAEEIKLKISK